MATPAHHKELNQETAFLIDAIKGVEKTVLASMEPLKEDATVDQRWLSIARTDMQKAFMSYIRAVANPDA